MRVFLRHKQHHAVVDVHAAGNDYRVTVNDRTYVVEARYLDDATLLLVIEGRRYRMDLARQGADRLVAVSGECYTFHSEADAPSAHSFAMVAAPEITAPMPGKVLQVLVHPGDHVDAGDGLLILEAMKMENRLVAEAAATVAELRVAAGDMVDGGQVLVVLQYTAEQA